MVFFISLSCCSNIVRGYEGYRMVLISCFPVKMGMADAIVDLVSSGTTLRENNLKEIEGGVVVQSQVNLISLTPSCFFSNRKNHSFSKI